MEKELQETHDYEALKTVLDRAFKQASEGKGKERHGNGLAFEEQPMQTMAGLLGTNHGMLFQAMKKIQESTRMDTDKAVHELLGAIVYIAGGILYLEGGKTTERLPVHTIAKKTGEFMYGDLHNQLWAIKMVYEGYDKPHCDIQVITASKNKTFKVDFTDHNTIHNAALFMIRALYPENNQ